MVLNPFHGFLLGPVQPFLLENLTGVPFFYIYRRVRGPLEFTGSAEHGGNCLGTGLGYLDLSPRVTPETHFIL